LKNNSLYAIIKTKGGVFLKKRISLALTCFCIALLVLFIVVFVLNTIDVLEAEKAVRIDRWKAMHLVQAPSIFVYGLIMFSSSILGLICSFINAKIAYCKKIQNLSVILSLVFVLFIILSFPSVLVWNFLLHIAFTH